MCTPPQTSTCTPPGGPCTPQARSHINLLVVLARGIDVMTDVHPHTPVDGNFFPELPLRVSPPATPVEQQVMTLTPPAGYVTRRQAAEMLGCHADTIDRNIKRGHYPGAISHKDSPIGAWLIPLEDLNLFPATTAVTRGIDPLRRGESVAPQTAEAVGALVIELARLLAEGLR